MTKRYIKKDKIIREKLNATDIYKRNVSYFIFENLFIIEINYQIIFYKI